MKNDSFPYKNVAQYLDAIGVLEQGTAEQIVKARKTFRKLYVKNYQKKYLKHHVNISISFSKKDKKMLKQVALENGKQLATYIKELALSSINNPIPKSNSSVHLKQIQHLFSLCYDLVEELQFENEYPSLKLTYDELALLFKQIETLLK